MKRILIVFVLLAVLSPLAAVGSWWTWGAEWLVVADPLEPAQIILIENFDRNYLLFERAAELMREGYAERVVVPVQASGRDASRPGAVPKGIVEVMSRVARLEGVEMVPVRDEEPITLNAALQMREFLHQHEIDSLIVVTDGFRSRRARLVYERVLAPEGIRFTVAPVFGAKAPDNWRQSWHGIQEVTLESAKLWYYRIFVL